MLVLLERKERLKDSHEHADDGQHRSNDFAVVVQEPVDGYPQPPLLRILVNG